MLEAGADDCPYVICRSGKPYENIVSGPTDQRLGTGDVFIVDAGARWDSYFSDFDRNFAYDGVCSAVAERHNLLWEATEAGIAAARPGDTFGDVWEAMVSSLHAGSNGDGDLAMDTGRKGHSFGMELTEPPSIIRGDPTKMEAGMVLAIEPFALMPGSETALLVHEEDVVVTAVGAELLSRRAPREIPCVFSFHHDLNFMPAAAPSSTSLASGEQGDDHVDGSRAVVEENRRRADVAPFLANNPASRAKLAFVQVPTDLVLDMSAPALLDTLEVEYRFQKLKFETEELTTATFEAARGNIVAARAATFLPGDMDCIGLACTSFSLTLGSEWVLGCLREGQPAATPVDMASSVVKALVTVAAAAKSNGAEATTACRRPRIGLLTPYVDELHFGTIEYLSRSGIDVVRHGSFELEYDTLTSAVSGPSIARALLEVAGQNSIGPLGLEEAAGEVDAFLISCSAFRSTKRGFIDSLEQRLGKPVITSEQALLWNMIRSAGVNDAVEHGYGYLFRL